jgi:hypothetical protein
MLKAKKRSPSVLLPVKSPVLKALTGLIMAQNNLQDFSPGEDWYRQRWRIWSSTMGQAEPSPHRTARYIGMYICHEIRLIYVWSLMFMLHVLSAF